MVELETKRRRRKSRSIPLLQLRMFHLQQHHLQQKMKRRKRPSLVTFFLSHLYRVLVVSVFVVSLVTSFHVPLPPASTSNNHYYNNRRRGLRLSTRTTTTASSSTSSYRSSSSSLFIGSDSRNGGLRTVHPYNCNNNNNNNNNNIYQRLRPLLLQQQNQQPPKKKINNHLGILVWSYPPDNNNNNGWDAGDADSAENNDNTNTDNDITGRQGGGEDNGNDDNDDDDNDNDTSSVVGYDGLYEFLTRRTGEQAGESERQRKRDRIMEWMKSSSSSSKKTTNRGNNNGGGGNNLIQPIRLQDGQVDEDLVAAAAANQGGGGGGSRGTAATTKATFDQLFAGMPSLDEILSKGESSNAATSTATNIASVNEQQPRTRRDNDDDYSWFEPERQAIEQEYRQICDDMKQQIRQQRLDNSNDEAIPDNAEGIVEAIVKQEMERMIDSVKITRAKERLQEYQSDRMAALDARDLVGATDAVVQQILKEAADDSDRQDKLQAQVDQFKAYELEQQQQQQQSWSSSSSPQSDNYNNANTDMDLDGWALERLEEMLEAAQNRDDDDGSVGDILEDNIEELRKKMEKESKKGSIAPTTMKEWQMYRAIATRLTQQQQSANALEDTDNNGEVDLDEALIAQRLNSWREYIVKEDGIRQRSGLSSTPELPFDFLGEKADRREQRRRNDADLAPAAAVFGHEKKTQREIRRDINIQAIQAMEDLIRKSDSVRAEGLQKELDALKAELEPRDFNDVEEEEVGLDPKSLEPIDLTDVFRRSEEDSDLQTTSVGGLSEAEYAGVNKILSNTGVDGLYGPSSSYQEPANTVPPDTPFFHDSSREEVKQPPPNTPFFQDDFGSSEERKKPPPNTPFFQEGSEGGRSGESLDVTNKLGSIEEQKLQAMYRRAGARTKAEQDKIRLEWEAFQQFEKERRDQSGLSQDAADSSIGKDSNLKYDISDVMTSDGDFDASKILSTIGPRPSRKKSKPSPASASPNDETSSLNESDTLDSDVSPSDVADSLYRSILAAGGGKAGGDPDLQKEGRSQFDEYYAKEQESRQYLDQLDDKAVEIAKSMDVPMDDAKYAEDVLNTIGSRPVFKRRRKDAIDERTLSDMGGVRSSHDDNDDDEDDEDIESVDSSRDDDIEGGTSILDDIVPAWVKKEREAASKSRDDSEPGMLGRNIDDVFDDDTYEKNLRQLHEYEQRRSGKKQMGIDISDIFGRRGSDDYVDYTYDTDYLRERQDGWSASSFQARKENLLQYIELDISEVNLLMAQKESLYSTGVSQYLPRINKPFSEFGAVFRLEGVLVDISGLQQKVWEKVAEEFGFRKPLLEDIPRAAVTRPEVVVREIIFRLNDIVEERKVLDVYRRILREAFEGWVREEGIVVQERDDEAQQYPDDKGTLAIGFDDIEPVPVVRPPDGEAARLKYIKEGWSKTAKQFGFPPPSNQQIAESSIVPPDIAVREIFQWTTDQRQIDQMVSAFAIMQAGGGFPPSEQQAAPPTGDSTAGSRNKEPQTMSEGEILELQYYAWKKVADDNRLEVPDPEEVLAAAVLNDPEVVVMSGFGWTEDFQLASSLANQYRRNIAQFLQQPVPTASTATLTSNDGNQPNVPDRPTDEEILSSQIEAWKVTASEFDFNFPSTDYIQMVMNLRPNEAVAQLLLMDYDVDEDVLAEITEFYTDAVQKASMKYLRKYGMSTTQPNSKTNSNISNASMPASKDVSTDEIYQAAFDAWTSIAWKNGYSMPDSEQVQFALSIGPRDAILSAFCWTDREEEAATIAQQYLDQIKTKRDDWLKRGYTTTVAIETNPAVAAEDIPAVRALPGVVEWLESLQKVEMACGVVSYLEEDQVRTLLDYAGLSELLPPAVCVSHTNGYQTDSQQLLGAALRIERRPDHCVAFDTSPYSSVAAHDMEMRSVSIVGPFPRYELLSADTTSSSVDELTAMNIRRLFGERVYDQPELDMMSRQPETTKRVKTAYDWDD